MLRTIEIGSCVSVQGEFVETLANGDVVIREGARLYRGRPVERVDPPDERKPMRRDDQD